MRIIFVRHGHPDYKKDCLTELGHLQADAVAYRLRGEIIKKIYTSSCGRAFETAEHIAEQSGVDVEKCDFMREVSWGPIHEEPILLKGHPWFTANDMVFKSQSLLNEGWMNQEPFSLNKVTYCVQKVAADFDQWLATMGYERDGLYYRVHCQNSDTVVMLSHGGSYSAVLAHLFNLTFPFVCATMQPDFTAITILSFNGKRDSLISPTVEILNDARHIADIHIKNIYDQ